MNKAMTKKIRAAHFSRVKTQIKIIKTKIKASGIKYDRSSLYDELDRWERELDYLRGK